MSPAVGHLWDALFAAMIVVAIFGNTAVLWIVIRKIAKAKTASYIHIHNPYPQKNQKKVHKQ